MHVCIYLLAIGDVESLDQENYRGGRPHRCTAGSHSVRKCLFCLINNSLMIVVFCVFSIIIKVTTLFKCDNIIKLHKHKNKNKHHTTARSQFFLGCLGIYLLLLSSHCMAWWRILEFSICRTVPTILIFCLQLCVLTSVGLFSFWCHHFSLCSIMWCQAVFSLIKMMLMCMMPWYRIYKEDGNDRWW